MYGIHDVVFSPLEESLFNMTIVSAIVVALIKGERKLEDRNTFAMLSLLAIFGVSGRILLEPIPNVQPVTVIVLLAGIYFGAPRAIALSGIIALSSNLILLGHGPWTLFQVIGWGTVGLIGSLLSSHLLREGHLELNRVALVSVVSAFLFDWIVSLSILLNTDVSFLMPYLVNGLLFDLYHAVGNLVFVAWIANPMGEIMMRHRKEPRNKTVSQVVTS